MKTKNRKKENINRKKKWKGKKEKVREVREGSDRLRAFLNENGKILITRKKKNIKTKENEVEK